VQGTSYPYLYCVLIAQSKAGLFRKHKKLIDTFKDPHVVIQATYSSEVDVLVIRQKTTRTSGYHTKIYAAHELVKKAIDLTRAIFKN